MFFSFALGLVVLVGVLLRQTRIRPVPRIFRARLPVILGVIGLFDLFEYTANHHHLSGADYLWTLGTLLIGAVVPGVIRGVTERVWAANGWVVRQGTNASVALWGISLAVQFLADNGGVHRAAAGLEQASFLLYVALTIGVQNFIVHRRGAPLWDQLGPDVGRPLQFLFGTSPGGLSTFFANFGGNPAGAGGGTGTAPGRQPTRSAGSDFIDVEVVDDEDPPELPRSR